MEYTGKADYLIKESGCGPFQALLILFVDILMKFATVYTLMFMVFGNYNPGWRCLDGNYTTTLYNATINSLNFSSTFSVSPKTHNVNRTALLQIDTKLSERYDDDSCELFTACQDVEFNPETSTIVTEWGLVCDKAWVSSFIISMQMAGMLAGSVIAGHLGDTFGRKKALYIAAAILCALSFAARFSTHWEVFTVIRFFMGVATACLYNLYNILPAEFLSATWRIRLASLPSWHIGGLLFCVAAMLCKDWKILHMTIGVHCAIACIPAIWVPESLRWLEVKNRAEDFQKVAKKMLTLNKITLPEDTASPIYANLSTEGSTKINNEEDSERKCRNYTVLDMFRKGYRLYTVIVAFIWFLPTLSYYAISYGVKAMHGDFYINLIVLFSADVPYSIIPMWLPNIIGRKKSSIFFLSISAMALITATGIGIWASPEVKNIWVFVLALLAKVNFIACMSCNLVLVAEMYPTVVRCNALAYCNFMARAGGIIAPLLIPSDSQHLSLYYGIIGTLCLICGLLMLKLPETQGKQMKELFDEEEIL